MGDIAILIILILWIHEPGGVLLLFRSSLISFNLVFEYMSCNSFVKCKCFIRFDTIEENKLNYFLLFQIVHRLCKEIQIDFCISVLYSAIFQNLFISSNGFFSRFLRVFPCTRSCHMQIEILLLFSSLDAFPPDPQLPWLEPSVQWWIGMARSIQIFYYFLTDYFQ